MLLTLNIGLNQSPRYPTLKPNKSATLKKAKTLFNELGFELLKSSVKKGDTEDTLIINFYHPYNSMVLTSALTSQIANRLYWLADNIGQDCIAFCVQDLFTGMSKQLCGKYAYLWGDFNENYFYYA